MKALKDSIVEKLQISRNKSIHTLFPKTTEELIEMIGDEIKKNGTECSLNHIDVSEITDMSNLFYKSEFNGDISKWDVSKVENMQFMFAYSKFTGKNGDINNWDISNVDVMYKMFYHSDFNSNIADWNCEDKDARYMLIACPIASKFSPKWI